MDFLFCPAQCVKHAGEILGTMSGKEHSISVQSFPHFLFILSTNVHYLLLGKHRAECFEGDLYD